MTDIKIGSLNPKVWGFTSKFKVVKKGETRSVKFKDDTSHKVAEHLVGDETGVILLNVWDEHIDKFEAGKTYELTEARMTVFQNKMKLTMSRKSEIKEISENIQANEENNMSEKHFDEAPKQAYNKNSSFKRGY